MDNTNEELTLGKIIRDARKSKGLNLREAADLIIKENNTPITLQYLNDIENNRRTPSEHIIKQISQVLNIPVEYLYVYAEMFPKGMDKNASKEQIVTAFKLFLREIEAS